MCSCFKSLYADAYLVTKKLHYVWHLLVETRHYISWKPLKHVEFPPLLYPSVSFPVQDTWYEQQQDTASGWDYAWWWVSVPGSKPKRSEKGHWLYLMWPLDGAIDLSYLLSFVYNCTYSQCNAMKLMQRVFFFWCRTIISNHFVIGGYC